MFAWKYKTQIALRKLHYNKIQKIRNIMELPVKIQSVLKADSEGFLCCTGKDYVKLFKQNQQKQSQKVFDAILDGLGALSAKAQALKQIITSSIKFQGSDHRIFIKVKDNKALGFVKVGQKNLFYRDFIGNVKELKPTCILDIYVHQSCQRSGIGKQVFEKFLRSQNKTPEKLAYDRPSQKLTSFLKKHYGLAKFVPQNNNFVIFDRYFNKEAPKIVSYQPQQKKQESPNVMKSSTPSNTKLRPKTYVPSPKQEQKQEKNIPKPEQKVQLKREFQQFQTLHGKSNNATHKNTTSVGFPLSQALVQNPAFRTTSNAYGNHYHYRNKNV